MVELSGLTVRDENNSEGDIELSVTGLRPGEKLYEELLIGDNPETTEHPRIMKAREDFLSWPELSKRLNSLNAALDRNDMIAARATLAELVSGYSSTGEVSIWLSPAPSQYVCLRQFKARCRVCRLKGCRTLAPNDGRKARAAAIHTNKGDHVSEDRIQGFLIEHDAKAARYDVAADKQKSERNR